MHLPTMEVLCLRRALPLALTVLLLACPKASSSVVGSTDSSGEPAPRPRAPARVDPQADEALSRTLQSTRSAPPAKAAEALLQVRTAYPETTAAQEALYQAGLALHEAGDWAGSRKALNELLFENPLHPKAAEARRRLGRAALELGACRDAWQTLAPLVEGASGPERPQLLEEGLRAAECAGQYGSALALAVALAGEAPSAAAQKAAVERVERLVEGRAAFLEVARVAEGLSSSHPAWPLLTFKLARIYYHLRDWQRLEESLQRLLAEAPSHPFAPRAREMLARATRRVEVSSNTVGVLLPMSGRYKAIGEAVLRGVQLALTGSDVELVVKDTQGDTHLTAQAMEQLAFDEGAMAVIGPLLTDDARRAALLAEELQVPLLTLSRQEGVTDIGPYVFRNMLTHSAQARAIADYALKVKGYKRFAVLYPNIPYGVELANAFWDQVAAQGGQVRGAESYAHDQTTFTSEAKKLVGRYYLEDRADYYESLREVRGETDAFRRRKAVEKVREKVEPVVDFDAIFIPDDWRRVSLVAPALAVEDIVTNACDPRDIARIRKTMGRNVKTVTLFGTNQWSSPKGRSGMPELIERGGKFVNCSVYVDGFFVDSQRPATRRFVQAYRSAYEGKEPGLLEAVGHDSAAMVRAILEKQKPRTRAAFRDSLAALKNFEGATGRTSFDERREAHKPLFLLSVDGKGVTELSPEDTQEGS